MKARRLFRIHTQILEPKDIGIDNFDIACFGLRSASQNNALVLRIVSDISVQGRRITSNQIPE
jgi:hypothetical protein